jgi:small subunit ribosomal protein S9
MKTASDDWNVPENPSTGLEVETSATKEMKQILAESVQEEAKAAIAAQYARPVPVSPSYFSRQEDFMDSYILLEDLYRKYGKLPAAPPDQVRSVAWVSREAYKNMTGIKDIKAAQYGRCVAMAKTLYKIHPKLRPDVVAEAVKPFQREINLFRNFPKPIPIDKFGRALGVGRRKTSIARAWVVEGTGDVQVNGKSLAGAFGRVHDRESATWALRSTERSDKYNVWALVNGGGPTGQAEALTLAIAKALIAHEPALKTALRRGKFYPSHPFLSFNSPSPSITWLKNLLTQTQPAAFSVIRGWWKGRSPAESRHGRCQPG